MTAMGGTLGRRWPIAAAVIISIVLAACGANQVTPASPTASAGSRPSSSAGLVPSGSPKPSPTSDPGLAALTRFFALVKAKGFSYQAAFTGESRHTVDIVPISKGLLQVSGKNVRVRATFKFRDGTLTSEHRSVDGVGWIRFDTTAWRKLASFGPEDSMAAFAQVHAPTDVTYLGPVKKGTKTFYGVRIPSVIVNPVMIPAANLTEQVVTDSRLDVLVDANGRPVSATGTITGHGRVSGQLQEIVIDLTVTFSKVGQAVTITAP